VFDSLLPDSDALPAVRTHDDGSAAIDDPADDTDFEPIVPDDDGAPDDWDDLVDPLPAASRTMSGAAGALAFDLSHPRDTPAVGVPACLVESSRVASARRAGGWRERWAAVRVWGAHLLGLDRSARAIAWLVAACVGLGVVMVYSTSAIAAERDPRIADPLFFLRRQTVAAGLALCACAVLAHCSLRRWRFFARCAPWLAVLALVAVLVPGIGHAANGARRWVRIAGIGFQPSDFARVGLIVYLALCAAQHAAGYRSARWRALTAIGGIVGLIAIEPDIGMAGMTMGMAVLTLWLGGLFRLCTIVAACSVLLPFAAMAAYAAFPHVRKRIGLFLGGGDAAAHSAGSHQLIQSYVALGAGGPTGVGLGAGRQKLSFLPEESTDFILAMIGEELGFLGTCTVVVLFAWLCVHGLSVAARARTPFAAVLAAGCTVLLSLQAAANVAVVTGLMPTTGIPLPFISFGGSGTVALALAAGALIAVARDPAGVRDIAAMPAPPEPLALVDDRQDVADPAAPAGAPRTPSEWFEFIDPTPDATILAPDLLAEMCAATADEDDAAIFDDSEPAIELERATVIREIEYRELDDPDWLDLSGDTVVRHDGEETP